MKEKRKQDLDQGEKEINDNGLIFHRVPSVGKMCFKTDTIDIYQFGSHLGKRRQVDSEE
jgi:hypothetical protein